MPGRLDTDEKNGYTEREECPAHRERRPSDSGKGTDGNDIMTLRELIGFLPASLTVGGEKLLYAGASAPGRAFFSERLPDAGTVIIGRHGPAAKEEYSLSHGRKTKTVIFGAAEDEAYCTWLPILAQKQSGKGENHTAEFRLEFPGKEK